MTRSTLRRTLRRVYLLLGLVLAISFLAKIADHVPGLAGTGPEKILKDLYEFLRDMSLLIATGGVAYITNVFQRRHAFVENLKAEWRDIIEAKSALLQFMHKPEADHAEYIAAFTRLSETIDNMRIVYRNVGETDGFIGLYPYAPLHDMRRVLQTLDPLEESAKTADRKLARDTMLRSFYALRERFLEELDLEEPDNPLLPMGARRVKVSGAQARARRWQQRQADRLKAAPPSEGDGGDGPRGDALLAALYEREASKAALPRLDGGAGRKPAA
jgi:hypothetical protein